LWNTFIHTPELLYHNDFLIQYTAGQILQKFGGHFLYNPDIQLSIQQQIIPENKSDLVLLPFNHPPILAPLFSIISKLPFLPAYITWICIQLFLLALCLWIIKSKWINGTQGLQKQFVYLLSLILFYPIFISILKGQDSIVVFFAVVIWITAIVQRQYILAGIFLAFCLLRPQIALVLAVPFLFIQSKVWWSFVITAGLMVFCSLALVGFTGVFDYIAILSATAQNSQYIMNQEATVNFIGLLIRLFPEANPSLIQGIGWIYYFLAIIVLSVIFKKAWHQYMLTQNRSHLLWAIALLILVAVFFSPYLHYHDLLLLLIPIIILSYWLLPAEEISMASVALPITSISLILLFSDMLPGHWRFLGEYLLLTYILLALINIHTINKRADEW
jgi:hypothetical protein